MILCRLLQDGKYYETKGSLADKYNNGQEEKERARRERTIVPSIPPYCILP